MILIKVNDLQGNLSRNVFKGLSANRFKFYEVLKIENLYQEIIKQSWYIRVKLYHSSLR